MYMPIQPTLICILYLVLKHVDALTTLPPDRLREKPGLCPQEMDMGICAEMCSYDVSCPGTHKCCSNGCGHVCMTSG